MRHNDDDDDTDTRSKSEPPGKAKDELFEAIDHLKNAANILFDRASKDPTLERASQEADRVFSKIAKEAEPLARQVSGELSKLTRRLSDAIAARDRKKDRPPSEDE
jgi:hypothetical protein